MPTSATSFASGVSLKKVATLIGGLAIAAVAVIAAAYHRAWLPDAQQLVASAWGDREPAGEPPAAHDDHAGHNHAADAHGADTHAGHDDRNSLHLSPQAWKNIGLQVGPVKLSDFERTTIVPAIIVERPGQTMLQVSAPLTGVVTGVYVTKGQAIEPGDLLFNLRLTHEDLVQTQTDFLKTLEALDVEDREIARLERITQGAVAGKVVLERQYEKQKLEALIRAQREGLMLHGLSDAQVQQIVQERKLLRDMAIRAPDIENHQEEQQLLENLHPAGVAPAEFTEATPDLTHPLVVQTLQVHQGQVVEAGASLCGLVDLKVLFIEGRGFEQDAHDVIQAANNGWPVTATFEDRVANPAPVTGLKIVYVANEVEAESRAFHYYVALPNEIVRDVQGPGGRRFVAWKYRPGQRTNLLMPVERWTQKIVLPVEALAQEGPEVYVFERNGDHFDRRPVHVEYRGQRQAVIANDGSIFPGDQIALNAAHQLQMALKNKSGGPIDPHAGHNH